MNTENLNPCPLERRVGGMARIRGFALGFCSFLCSFLNPDKRRHYLAFGVLFYLLLEGLHKISDIKMSLLAVIIANVAIIVAHIAHRSSRLAIAKASLAIELASSAIASVRSSRASRLSEEAFDQANFIESCNDSN